MPRAGLLVLGLAGISLIVPTNVGALTRDRGGSATAGFQSVDTAMQRRVRDRGGGAAVVVHDRTVLFHRSYRGFHPTTVIPIASASKWLTAATLMTLVDEGRLTLDDPVSRFLPAFTGPKASVTIRSLLSHTSGLPDSLCAGDDTTTLRACVDQTAAGEQPTTARAFQYSAVGYLVAGRIIEVLTGQSFEQAFEDRIAKPVGMRRTRFDGTERPKSHNPNPAASAVSTVDDYARFLDMLVHDGTSGTRQVLTPASVLEIERDQVRGLDTSHDAAVAITRIPTYGLGVWRDVTDPSDGTVIVSGNGALGFYPWIDRSHENYGIVGVVDDRGPEAAVPASQRVARLEWTVAARRT
jgi:CubicO group peptidase (beta-lactamase class C family)